LSSRTKYLKRISAVENGTLVTPSEIIEGGSVAIEDGRITDVIRKSRETTQRARNATVLDAENRLVIPGMIDIHTHGLGGGSALDGANESILKMSFSFPRYGVTGFLPTTVAEPKELLLSAARAVGDIIGSDPAPDGAEVLGMNLEGPFISKIKPGAQPVSSVRDPDINEFNEIYRESDGSVKLITVAPEVNGALDFIKKVRAGGVTVAAGHSNASYEEMLAGINAGITHASHTFNAMREFKQRDPGMLAAILIRDEVTAELIADNVHVHEGAMRLLMKAKGFSKIVLVSDSMPLAGLPDGTYNLMGFNVGKDNGVLRLPSGQLAGSTVTLDKSLRIAVNQLGVPLRDAVSMVTINPAIVIKAEDSKGAIEKGRDADLTILDKDDLSIYATIIRGRIAYHRSDQ
jgi:N-acetylglucosamine-6-phosphate deacetylase